MNCISNKYAGPEFLSWLSSDDYSDISLRDIPETGDKKDMKLFNTEPWYPWLQSMYMTGEHWSTGDAVAQLDLVGIYNEKHPRMPATNQAFTKMFKTLGFCPANGRGHHWYMMSYEDFQRNMMANGKWDEYM